MIIDVHAHADFLSEEKLVEIQKDKKIRLVISNSVNLNSCKKNLEFSRKYSKIRLAAGLYPEEDLTLTEYSKFEKFVRKNKKEIIAIGEIGIDKKEIFFNQLNLAKELNLPVIVHSRKAEKEALDILEDYKDNLKIILHCFSGNFNLIKRAVELGFSFSIPANIMRSEHFQKMAGEIPHERILTETDSPLLSPYKEMKNEPSFIKESIKKFSEIWNISEDKVEKIIEENFNKIFKF